MESMDTMETVLLHEDVNTEVVESCYTLSEVTSPKKSKKKAQEDTADKPKKPRSAYLLYYFDFHQGLQQESPNLPQSEINKRISESWRRLTVSEKAYYLEKAKLEKEGVDTSSVTSTQDLPGFRKILPRANHFPLPKGPPPIPQAGDPGPGPLDSQDPPLPEDGSSIPLPVGTQYPALALESEVEFAEQCIAIENLAEETASMSEPMTAFQGLPPRSPSSPVWSNSAPPDPQTPLASVDSCRILLAPRDAAVMGNGVFNVLNSKTGDSVVGRDAAQPIKQDLSQVVTFLPAQNLVETKSVANINSISHVMMVSVGTAVKQNTKPSYRMAVKTYTRRGRGRCPAPGCLFIYVTRHKPPTCPECGGHLGGKWVPTAKKSAKQSKQLKQEAEIDASNGGQAKLSLGETGPTAGVEGVTQGWTDGTSQPGLRRTHAANKGQTLEGASTKAQSRASKPTAKGITVKGQDKGHVTMKRRPVRPILPAYCPSGRTVLQFITVPPDKGKDTCNNTKAAVTANQSMSGLKPNTLKQLGHVLPSAAAPATVLQGSVAGAQRGQVVTSLNTKGVNYVSVVPFKQSAVSSFDLGLSTARGRGRCKNPSCDYMYKNRHKPAECPQCGWELSRKSAKGAKAAQTLLDPYQALNPAQLDLQRQSTLQLLRRALQIPEGDAELQDTLALIQELNGAQVVLSQCGETGGPAEVEVEAEAEVQVQTEVRSGWPRYFESAATHCGLCQYPLFKGGQSTIAGQEDCWLLTETLIQTASLQLKVCLNTQCLALHSFTDIHPGLFNIGNKLLVSLDLFLKMRDKIRLGHHPSEAAGTILDHIPHHPVHALSPEESTQVRDLLLSGYWAFESLTVRDYNDMICGVCGVAPRLEVAQRFSHNALELHNVQFTWPEGPGSDEVLVEDFWLTMESEAIEQAAFPSDIPVTQLDAAIVAPFVPPLMRGAVVLNTEKDKVPWETAPPAGDAALLVRLIHEGQLRLDALDDHREDELRDMLCHCGETPAAQATKEEMLGSLLSLYAHIQSGLPTAPQPAPNRTAGKLSKVCPHKVVCGSKYLVRGETARDHVDLLLSSRYWPPVYVTDAARPVALCADMRYPELAGQMWGRNQGCFSDPLDKAQLVSCAELCGGGGADLSSGVRDDEEPLVHPVTRSSSRWLVHPSAAHPSSLDHHSMGLCRELEPYAGLGAAQETEAVVAGDDGPPRDLRRPLLFGNAAYYYLYNRLVDFLRSREIVSGQIGEVLAACQPGEVVIRDALYRLGVAQINTELGEEEEVVEEEGGKVEEEDVQQEEEGGGAGEQDTLYEVMLP